MDIQPRTARLPWIVRLAIALGAVGAAGIAAGVLVAYLIADHSSSDSSPSSLTAIALLALGLLAILLAAALLCGAALLRLRQDHAASGSAGLGGQPQPEADEGGSGDHPLHSLHPRIAQDALRATRS